MNKKIITILIFLSTANIIHAQSEVVPCITVNAFGSGNGIIGINGGLQFPETLELGVGYSTRFFSADAHAYMKAVFPLKSLNLFISPSINYTFRGATPAMYQAAEGFIAKLRFGIDYYFDRNWFIELDLDGIIPLSDEPALR